MEKNFLTVLVVLNFVNFIQIDSCQTYKNQNAIKLQKMT